MRLHTISLALLCSVIGTTQAMNSKAVTNQADEKVPQSIALTTIKHKHGRTPLHAIAYQTHVLDTETVNNVIRTLVAHGASVNAQDPAGLTPLHFCAIYQKSPGTMQFLKNLGADITLTCCNGNTPLMLAMETGRLDCIEVLLHTHTPPNQALVDPKSVQQ